MSGQSILIISNGALCRNPRVVKEASCLAEAGYNVTVLTVRNHPPSEPTDLEILRTAKFRRLVVDTLPQFTGGRWKPFAIRARTWLARKAVENFGIQAVSSLGPAQELLRLARSRSPNLVIVHNEVAHWIGTRLLAEGRKVAADIEDWHSEDLLEADRRGRPLSLIRSVEHTLLKRAIYTTTTSHALSQAMHARYGGTAPQVITNSFPLQPHPRQAKRSEPVSFFWFSQRLGPGRGLESFVAAWALMKAPTRLALLGESHGEYTHDLLRQLPEGRRSLVSILPLVAPSALPSLIAQHDIGLALEQSEILNRDLTITNKILQYLNAGLAVVASDTAGHREVLGQEPAAGIVLRGDTPAATASLLDAFVSDRATLETRQASARLLAESRYCWDLESKRLAGIVAHALG